MTIDREPDGISIDGYPAPTHAEAAAIVSALRARTREQPSAGGAPTKSAWQRAARGESLRTELTHADAGWRRAARLDH